MSTPADDPWAEAAKRLRQWVARRPYLSVLAGGGVGWFLAGSLGLRMLPGLVSLGARVAVASALPTLTDIVREGVSSPDP